MHGGWAVAAEAVFSGPAGRSALAWRHDGRTILAIDPTPGMLLAVPLTVVAVIVMNHFDFTRPVSRLMSTT